MMDKVPHWKPRARVEKVIIVEYLAGAGTAEEIAWVAKVIYDLDGKLIAEHDPCGTDSSFAQGDFLPWEIKKEEPPCPTK